MPEDEHKYIVETPQWGCEWYINTSWQEDIDSKPVLMTRASGETEWVEAEVMTYCQQAVLKSHCGHSLVEDLRVPIVACHEL